MMQCGVVWYVAERYSTAQCPHAPTDTAVQQDNASSPRAFEPLPLLMPLVMTTHMVCVKLPAAPPPNVIAAARAICCTQRTSDHTLPVLPSTAQGTDVFNTQHFGRHVDRY